MTIFGGNKMHTAHARAGGIAGTHSCQNGVGDEFGDAGWTGCEGLGKPPKILQESVNVLGKS